MKHRSSATQARSCGNPHCGRRTVYARGRCQACYVFLCRNDRDPAPAEMRTRWQRLKRCQNCDRGQVYARRRCKRCYQFWWRTGRERPAEGQKRNVPLCLNCGQRPPYRLGRCRGCFGYLTLHGKDREQG